jgi:CheY-like chemotaxis protein
MSRPARILVVDDEKSLRQIVGRTISKLGHECVTATNGVDALEAASRQAFDLVITDLNMPKMGGLALIEWLRKKHPGLPIIIMTAYADLESARKALRLRVADYLVKPFEGLAEVQAAVQRALATGAARSDTPTLVKEFETRAREFDRRERHLSQKLERTQVKMKALAKQLEQSEAVASRQIEHIEELIGDIENGILITDTNGTVLSVNQELRKQLEIPNFHGSGFSVERIPGDSGLREAILESRLRRKTGVEEPVLVETTCGSGSSCTLQVCSTRLANRRGATVGMMTTVRPVRKPRAQRSRLVADGAGHATRSA